MPPSSAVADRSLRVLALPAETIGQDGKGEGMNVTLLAGLHAASAFVERGSRGGRRRWTPPRDGGRRGIEDGEEAPRERRSSTMPLMVSLPQRTVVLDGASCGSRSMHGKEPQKEVWFTTKDAHKVLSLLAAPLWHQQRLLSNTQQEREFLAQCVEKICRGAAMANVSDPHTPPVYSMPLPFGVPAATQAKERDAWWQQWRAAGWMAPCDEVEATLGRTSGGENGVGASSVEREARSSTPTHPLRMEEAAPPRMLCPSPFLPPPSTAALEAVLANCFLTAVYCPRRFLWGGGETDAMPPIPTKEEEEEKDEKKKGFGHTHPTDPWLRRRVSISSSWPSASGAAPSDRKEPFQMLWPTAVERRLGRPTSPADPLVVPEEVFAFTPLLDATVGRRASVPSATSPPLHVGGAVFQHSTLETYVTLFSVAFQQSIHRCGATFSTGKNGGLMGSGNRQMGGKALDRCHGPRLVLYGNAQTMTPTAVHAAQRVGYTHIRLLPAISDPQTGNMGLTLETFQAAVAEDMALGRVPSILCCSVLQGPAAVVDAVGELTRFCTQVGIWCHLVMGGEIDTNEGERNGAFVHHRNSSMTTKGSGASCLSLLRYMKEMEKMDTTGTCTSSSSPSPTRRPTSETFFFSSAASLPRLFQRPYQLALQACREGMDYADSFHWSLVEGDEDALQDDGLDDERWTSDLPHSPDACGASSSSPISFFQPLPSCASGPACCGPCSSRVSLVHQVLSDAAAPLLALPHDLTLLAMADIRKLTATAHACGWGGGTTSSSSSSSSSSFRFSFCSLPSVLPPSLFSPSASSSSCGGVSIPPSPLPPFSPSPTQGRFCGLVPLTRSYHGAVTASLLHAMGVAVLLRCVVNTQAMRQKMRADEANDGRPVTREAARLLSDHHWREGEAERAAPLHQSDTRTAEGGEARSLVPNPPHDIPEWATGRFSFHWCSVVTALVDLVVADGRCVVRVQSVLGGRVVFRWRTLADECTTALGEAIGRSWSPLGRCHADASSSSSSFRWASPSTAAVKEREEMNTPPTPFSPSTHHCTTVATTNANTVAAYDEDAEEWERWVSEIPLYCSVVTIERRPWVSLRWGGGTDAWSSPFFSIAYHKARGTVRKQSGEDVGEKRRTYRGVPPPTPLASLGPHASHSPVLSSTERDGFSSAVIPHPTCVSDEKVEAFIRRKCVDTIWKNMKNAMDSFW